MLGLSTPTLIKAGLIFIVIAIGVTERWNYGRQQYRAGFATAMADNAKATRAVNSLNRRLQNRLSELEQNASKQDHHDIVAAENAVKTRDCVSLDGTARTKLNKIQVR